MSELIFITGADKKCEWMLPWWLGKFRKYNTLAHTPVIIADFGLSDKAKQWCSNKGLEIQKITGKAGWYMKPSALRQIKPESKRVWVDVDCEVVKDCTEIFEYIEKDKLTCSTDRHHSWGCKFQTGVVGVMGDPDILQKWEASCLNPKGPYGRGDQELLWELTTKIGDKNIKELPEKFNWLRMSLLKGEDDKDKRIIHWTGEEGKKIIIKSIREKKRTTDYFIDTAPPNNPTIRDFV